MALIVTAAVICPPDCDPRKISLSADFLGLSSKTEDRPPGEGARTLVQEAIFFCCGHNSLLFLDSMAQQRPPLVLNLEQQKGAAKK